MHTSSLLRQQRIATQRQRLVYTEASERIATALRSGMIPWKNQVISDDNAGLPLNVATRKPFTPISTLLLQVAAQKNSFVGKWWGTIEQLERVGGIVDASSEATIVFDETWLPFELYCVDQVVGESVDRFRVHDFSVVTEDNANFDRVDRPVTATGADIRIGVGDENHPPSWNGYVAPNPWIAFPNHPVGDYILIAKPDAFASLASYYYTLLHELIHWAEVRTDWLSLDMPMRELVAEIGSGWLALELGCPPCPCPINHQKWLPAWLYEIKHDVGYVGRATEQAWRAVRFVLSPET